MKKDATDELLWHVASTSGRLCWVGVRGYKDSSSWVAGLQSVKGDEIESFEVDAGTRRGAVQALSNAYERKAAAVVSDLEQKLANARAAAPPRLEGT